MNNMTRHSGVLRRALVVAALLLTSGCAQESKPEAGNYVDLTLLETKMSAQLIRNVAASRVPSEVIAEVGETADRSAPCLTGKEDPEGEVRAWHSTITVLLRADNVANVDAIIDLVAASFVEEGWNLASLRGSAVIHTRYLSGESSSTIELKATSTDTDAQYVATSELENASIAIDVFGPCVMTGGADSREVKDLEQVE